MNAFSLLGRGAMILASAGLALACSHSNASPNSSQATATPVTAATMPGPPTPVPTQNPEDLVPRISPEEAKKLVDAGKAIIIDVRGPDAYKLAHIKGSLEYGLSKIEQKDFSGLPKNKQIIAYCT